MKFARNLSAFAFLLTAGLPGPAHVGPGRLLDKRCGGRRATKAATIIAWFDKYRKR